MTSHILLPQIDPAVPATFSRRILQGLLRDELEFDGVIVSDALDMQGASHEIGIPEAAVRALIAGCDLLCLGTNTGAELLREIEEAVVSALGSGRLGEDRLLDAAHRVRTLAASSSNPTVGASAARNTANTGNQAGSEKLASTGNLASTEAEVDINELVRITRSFDGLAGARVWLAAHPHASVIRVESEANMAVGFAPWGPFAAIEHPLPGTEILAQKFAARPHRTMHANDGTSKPGTLGQRNTLVGAGHIGEVTNRSADGIIVIVRDLHRMPKIRAEIHTLSTSGTPVLVIEMGWPNATAANDTSEANNVDFVQLDCYGSSRLVGAAVLQLVEGERS